jgi:hypothetical protein
MLFFQGRRQNADEGRINLSLSLYWFDLRCISSWNRNSIQSELYSYFRFKHFLEPYVRKVLPSIKDYILLQTLFTTYVKKRQNATESGAKILLGHAGSNFWDRHNSSKYQEIWPTHYMRPRTATSVSGELKTRAFNERLSQIFGNWDTKQRCFTRRRHEQTQQVGKNVWAVKRYIAILPKRLTSQMFSLLYVATKPEYTPVVQVCQVQSNLR